MARATERFVANGYATVRYEILSASQHCYVAFIRLPQEKRFVVTYHCIGVTPFRALRRVPQGSRSYATLSQ